MENKIKEITNGEKPVVSEKYSNEIEFLGQDKLKYRCSLGNIKCTWRMDQGVIFLEDVELPKFKITNVQTGTIAETNTIEYLNGPHNHKWSATLIQRFLEDGTIEFVFKHVNWLGEGGQETKNMDYNDWSGEMRSVRILPMKVEPTQNSTITYSVPKFEMIF